MLTKIAFLLVVVYVPLTPAPKVIPGQVQGPGAIPGGIPGGIGPCEPIVTPLHLQVATAALNQIGLGHTLRLVLSQRSQVVAGQMYYLKLHVSNFDSIAQGKCDDCKVRAWLKLPNAAGIREVELQNYSCERVCCIP